MGNAWRVSCVMVRRLRCILLESRVRSSPPRVFAVYANAQFGVTRDRMRMRPLAVYEALLREFEPSLIDSCFATDPHGPKSRPGRGTCALMEFLWPTIMGEPPVVDTRRTMSGRVAPRAEHGPTIMQRAEDEWWRPRPPTSARAAERSRAEKREGNLEPVQRCDD